jgi:transketolase
MRDAFVRALTARAADDPRVLLLTADLGFRLFDDFAQKYPGRFFNVGVAEANMISVAAGLALDGKRPFVYSIVPFVTARCLDQIRIDLCEMRLPVTVVGVGGGYAYGPNGPSHHGVDDVGMLRSLPGMTVIAPCDPRETAAAVRAIAEVEGPVYLRLGRANDTVLPGTDEGFTLGEPAVLKRGSSVLLLACGAIASEVLQAADLLKSHGVDPAVASAHTVKPLGRLPDRLAEYRAVFVIEEHGPHGGAFEAIAGAMASRPAARPALHQICAPDRFHERSGSAAFLRRASGLDAAAMAERILRVLETREQ